MNVLVTGSSGHLGEAMVRTLRPDHRVASIDILPSAFTDLVADITDREAVRSVMAGVDTVFHAATLHKPHVGSHTKGQFIDTNNQGTLVLLEEAVAAGVKRFIFTSTTSTFGDAMRPPAGEPAVWITESVTPVPKNIYGVTKTAAEDLCHLFSRKHGLACLVLRTSRFFPEDDDNADTRSAFSSDNAKANEFLYRRADISDIVGAHLLAAERAESIGFARFIISATTPFLPEDLPRLREDAPAVLVERVPAFQAIYERLGWRMFPGIDRVYDNRLARELLGWQPRFDFAHVLQRLEQGLPLLSTLAQEVGAKGYHGPDFQFDGDGPFPVN